MRLRRIAIAALLVLAACRETTTSEPGPAPAPPVAAAIDAAFATPAPDAPPAPPSAAVSGTTCDHDDDCMVTNFAGCCACPQCQVAAPHPITRAQEKLEEDKCAVASCDMGHCGAAGMCPPGEAASHFVARCVDHACTMQHQ
jgi:hypothetical protein